MGKQQPYMLTVVVLVLSAKRCPVRSTPATSSGKAIDTRSLRRRGAGSGAWASIHSLCRQNATMQQNVHRCSPGHVPNFASISKWNLEVQNVGRGFGVGSPLAPL